MSTKKAPTDRPSARVKVAVPGGKQSVAERRAAEGEVRRLIVRFAPEQLRLVAAVRRSLLKLLPTAHEVVYEYRDCFVISFSPSEHGYEGVLAIRGSADGLRLYFNRGKELTDPEKLLQGSGRQARFVAVERASMLARPAVVCLIEEAIAGNRKPFAPDGHGSVVTRSNSAKKGKRGRSV